MFRVHPYVFLLRLCRSLVRVINRVLVFSELLGSHIGGQDANIVKVRIIYSVIMGLVLNGVSKSSLHRYRRTSNYLLRLSFFRVNDGLLLTFRGYLNGLSCLRLALLGPRLLLRPYIKSGSA